MEILLLIFAFFIILRLINHHTAIEATNSITEVVEVKQCPPHKWSHIEVQDTDGNTVKWKLVCAVCGPMQSQDRPRGGDYS